MRQSKLVVDAFVASGGEYLIYSSVSPVSKISNGRLKNVTGFDVKADVQDYIKTLPIKSAFYLPGSLMQNYHAGLAPKPVGDGTFAIFNFISPDAGWPLTEAKADTGKWIGAILADPAKYEGKELSAATKVYNMVEITESLSKATGKTVKYIQMPEEQFRGFMKPGMTTQRVEMFQFVEQFGYYGPDTAGKVKWSAEQARGKLSTLDDYLQKNPLNLDSA